MVTVCTVLPPPERPRLDAAGDGCFNALHADSLREALYVARRRRVDAVIISVHRCHGEALPGVARFVREFPAIPAVALVSHHDREATETLLRLGATGVRNAVDWGVGIWLNEALLFCGAVAFLAGDPERASRLMAPYLN